MVATMTQEEKARAYDEVLERAQKVHRYSSDLAEIKRMEDIFPELAMSEDERIKKEFCKDIWTFIPNERAHKYIAWLEKQGKQKHAKSIVETWKDMRLEVYQQASGNRHEPNYSDDTTKMFSLNNIDEIIEKMSEQNHADKVGPKFKVKYAGNEYNVLEIKEIAGVTYYGIEDEPNHIDYVLPDNCEIVRDYGFGVKETGSPYPTKSAIFSEQNPGWSEDDDMMIEETLYFLREYQQSNRCKDENGMQNSVSCEKWLKSLKEKINEKQ